MNTPRLTREHQGRPAAPVRIVHLGIGNFARAHQAWYTEHTPDAQDWGIAAFTGRRPTAAEELEPQDGLYTLVTRGAEGDSFEVISSLSAVHPADDQEAFLRYLADDQVAIVTTTVTETGYYRDPDGRLNTADDAVAADLDAYRESPAGSFTTVPVRLVAGLRARIDAGAGPLTVLPCDNLPENGTAFRTVVEDAAREIDPEILAWAQDNVDWATSMVDRITPATTDDLRSAVEQSQGYVDVSPVPTEPFSEWVISGAFPAGRPAWDDAGVTLVDDVRPFEERKLWLLNGSHSLMAYAATILGHETVADAIADTTVRDWVEQWWDEAARYLEVPEDDIRTSREALLDRYENPNIRHQLAQIASDGSQKLPVRIAPVLTRSRRDGLLPDGALRTVAAWVLHLRGLGAPVKDSAPDLVARLTDGSLEDTVEQVVRHVAPELDGDPEVRERCLELARELEELGSRK